MYTYYSRTLKDTALKEIQKPRPGVWIVADALSEEELATLARAHRMDEGILRDATDYYEVPRVEREEGVVYFFARYPVQTPDGDMSTAPILVALGESFVLTVTHTSPAFIKKLIKSGHGAALYTTQRTKLFLHILHAVTGEYNRSVMALRREVRKHFGHFSSISEKDIERFVGLESTANDYISALVPTQAALKEILERDFITFHETDEDLLEDLVITQGQLLESSNNLAKTIQNIRNAYSTIVAGRLNRVMKTLTALTIILTVPMIVTSFYGMNVPLPLAESPHAFGLIVAIIAALSAALGYLFARNQWL